MRTDYRIRLDSAQFDILRCIDLLSENQSSLSGPRARAMVSNIDINQHIKLPDRRARRFVVPNGLLCVINHNGRARCDGSCNLQWIAQRGCEMNARDSGRCHQLCFRHGRDANSDGSRRKLTFGDLRAFMRLGVRPQRLSARLHLRSHAGQVRFE